MTIEDGDYIPDGEESIYDTLATIFEDEYGDESDVETAQLIQGLLSALASGGATTEQHIGEVYDNSFLETATGESLDMVVDEIGLRRRSAQHATGIITFQSDSPVSNEYTIQNGTTVQTGGSDPIKFETTEVVSLSHIDGFESGALDTLYEGNRNSFSVVDGTTVSPSEGNYHLEVPSTADVGIHHSETDYSIGTTFHVSYYANPNTVTYFQWGLRDQNNHYRCRIDDVNGEVAIEVVDEGSVVETVDSTSTSIPTSEYGRIDVTWRPDGEMTVTLRDGNEDTVASVSGAESTPRYYSGHIGYRSGDGNDVAYIDDVTTSEVSATIRALVGGPRGNIGPNTITTMPSPPTGVNTITNYIPTGNDGYTNTDGVALTVGEDRETDDELRERARETVTKGGSATIDALLSSLIHEYGEGDERGVDGIQSASVYTNKSIDDNTGNGGLPPKSFEVVVHGGDESEIANAIFDTVSVTDRWYGGVHGTSVTVPVTAVNGQVWDVQFSRPNEVSVDITIDLVVDDTYAGDDVVKNAVIEYIGGVDTDNTTVNGIDVGENVYWDEVHERIKAVTGVVGVSSYSTTPSLTGDSNGLEVIEIGANEVALTDGTDTSITVNVSVQ